MDFEAHCKASEALFGQRFEEVHHWLDEFAQKPGIGMKHRKFRHHLEGIATAGALFGKDGGRAALQHVIDDLHQEGWHEKRDRMPKDETDYGLMGLF